MAHLVAIPWAMDMLSNQWIAFLSIQLRRPRHELNRQKLMKVSTSTLFVLQPTPALYMHTCTLCHIRLHYIAHHTLPIT